MEVLEKFLRKTIRENSGKKKRTLQSSFGLGKAKDIVFTNQFGYFMYTRKQNCCKQQKNYNKIMI